MIRALIFIFLLAAAQGASAFSNDAAFKDVKMETRAKELFKTLRCVVCTSQSIGESEAELAKDMRSLIRARMAEGKSDDEIRQYLVSRYGGEILLEPPLNEETILMWLLPFIILISGGWIIFRKLKS